jgi:hypothetical protein
MNTNNLVEFGRARLAHANQRRLLREKYEAKMIFAHAGGMWRAGPELQTTLLTCPDAEAVILDLYETPVRINSRELLSLSQQRWQEQMTAWLLELETISSQR